MVGVREVGVIVVGAGQAGLAAGYCLAQARADFVVLDAEARVGDGWRRRWPSLRLITPAGRNSLPGCPWPAPSDHLPSRDEVADYFEAYARTFALPIESRTRVSRLSRSGYRYVVETSNGRWAARAVIVATGAFHRPWIPPVADGLAASIYQCTAPAYRSAADLPPGHVLVVGAGNSGAQIAADLAPHRSVWLAGPPTGHLPRRVLGRDVYHWIWPLLRLRTTGWPGRWIGRWWSGGGHPLVGLSERDLHRAGVVRVGRVTGVADGAPVVEGAGALAPAVIIWCTGYRPDFSWIDLPVLDDDGWPVHAAGLVPDLRGLGFVGVPYARRLNSGLMGGVGDDAREIVAAVLGA